MLKVRYNVWKYHMLFMLGISKSGPINGALLFNVISGIICLALHILKGNFILSIFLGLLYIFNIFMILSAVESNLRRAAKLKCFLSIHEN